MPGTPGCRIPSCNTISSAQAPQVNMARRREQPCLWLVAPCDVRARRTERKVVSRGGGFYSRRGHPIYSIESMGSNQGGVPLTPPKELIIHSPSFILPTHNPVLKRTPNWVLPVKSREILSTGQPVGSAAGCGPFATCPNFPCAAEALESTWIGPGAARI